METKLHFNQCTLPLLDKLFGLRRTTASPILDRWLAQAAQIELSAFERQY